MVDLNTAPHRMIGGPFKAERGSSVSDERVVRPLRRAAAAAAAEQKGQLSNTV
jgi:hypothetical protein